MEFSQRAPEVGATAVYSFDYPGDKPNPSEVKIAEVDARAKTVTVWVHVDVPRKMIFGFSGESLSDSEDHQKFAKLSWPD